MMCSPVAAQGMSTAEKVINLQATRFHDAYAQYVETCINLDKDEKAKNRIFGRLPDDCKRAREHYQLQADILVQLIHGKQAP
ncbi:MAG: hypothetical protein V4606_02855 [Patescibacteria group bacterium]